MSREHSYSINISWTGNTGTGTSGYHDYLRDHEVSAPGKAPIAGSSDPGFHGDKTRYNPEELLVATLSACHMLWYLHLCSEAGIVVVEYQDDAKGKMVETEHGGGYFAEVTLRPVVKVSEGCDPDLALQLHEKAHHLCFIANSVNFPVLCEPSLVVG